METGLLTGLLEFAYGKLPPHGAAAGRAYGNVHAKSIGKMRHLFGLSVQALRAPPGSGSSRRIVCQSFDRARSTVGLPVGPYPDQSGRIGVDRRSRVRWCSGFVDCGGCASGSCSGGR